jgi:hypothetical protein
VLISNINLDHEVAHTIQWKLTSGGIYLAFLTYKMQFEGLIKSTLNASVGKVWAPPK